MRGKVSECRPMAETDEAYAFAVKMGRPMRPLAIESHALIAKVEALSATIECSTSKASERDDGRCEDIGLICMSVCHSIKVELP